MSLALELKKNIRKTKKVNAVHFALAQVSEKP